VVCEVVSREVGQVGGQVGGTVCRCWLIAQFIEINIKLDYSVSFGMIRCHVYVKSLPARRL
jgi:hypothetical protein